MEFYKEAELLCTVPIARVLAVEDSTRYFLMKDVKCSRPNGMRLYVSSSGDALAKLQATQKQEM
jgi:hypothetical protein